MMSQAMEQVTRAFYARSDLDLILSSPTASRRVFAVRIGAMAVSTMMMAVLLAAPFINVLIWRGGARWLSAYGVVIATGARGSRPVGRADCAAVPHHRAEAHAPCRADRRRHCRRDIRDRAAGRGHSVLRHAVLFHVPEVGRARILRARGGRAWCGGRPAPRSAILPRSRPCSALGALLLGAAIAIFSQRFGEHAIAAAGVVATAGRDPTQTPGLPRDLAGEGRPASQGMDCCSRATRGSPRRR